MLFVVIIFYKVTTNTELAHTELWFQGKVMRLHYFESLITVFPSTSEHITLYYVCLYLKTFNIHYVLLTFAIELSANTVTQLNEALACIPVEGSS